MHVKRHPKTAFAWAVGLALLLIAPDAAVAQDTGSIRGTVTEAGSLRPLSGVQVFIVGTTRGTITNVRGEYQIVGMPVGTVQISARMVGYAAATQSAAIVSGQAVRAEFTMSAAAVELNEIVVTGTAGGTQRRAIGNAVTSVNAAQVTEAAPILSTPELLQGRAPGLTLMQPSGTPGTATNIRIRGAGSLSAGNQPVFYINGVRITAGSQGGWSVSGQATSALDTINREDIESIEVIKSPAAATLCGADAAAGVIQIITKRGTRGQQGIRWNAKVETGQSAWGGRLPDHYGFCTHARITQANNIAAGTGVYPAGSFPGCAGMDPNRPT